MKVGDFKRLARRTQTQAAIIGDGCRDYFIEIRHEHGTGVLTDRRGRPMKFKSIVEAKDVARHAHQVKLALRVAADEACAGTGLDEAKFASMPLISKVA